MSNVHNVREVPTQPNCLSFQYVHCDEVEVVERLINTNRTSAMYEFGSLGIYAYIGIEKGMYKCMYR